MTEETNEDIPRGPFDDPVVRCDSCVKLVRMAQLKQIGACPHCGNKRVRDVTVFNSEERDQMIAWDMRSFLEQFEPVADE